LSYILSLLTPRSLSLRTLTMATGFGLFGLFKLEEYIKILILKWTLIKNKK
jgi:hypothetical protein